MQETDFSIAAANAQFEALVRETQAMRAALQAGAVLDLRSSLVLRHRLLLASDDVVNAFTLYKSIARFRKAGGFERSAAHEAEGVFAPMIFFLNEDKALQAEARADIVRMAQEAAHMDTSQLADSVRKLARDRQFYREALEELQDMRAQRPDAAKGSAH